jgi:hypothetical protein
MRRTNESDPRSSSVQNSGFLPLSETPLLSFILPPAALTTSIAPMPDRQLAVQAAPVFTFHGRLVARAKGFVRPKQLTCPDGHRVRELAVIREDGALWCTHRPASGQGECGAMLYIIVLPSLGGRRRIWASDVTKPELDEMEALGLDADGALAYFGVEFTR